MCGRFSISVEYSILKERFSLDFAENYAYKPVYNAAPGLLLPVITDEEPSFIKPVKWGLVPSWVKNLNEWNPLINARLESIETKPSFKRLIRNGRCIVPADGFFEWKTEGKRKIPYRFILENERIFSFAGLWDKWQNKDSGEILKTFTIITTEAEDPVKSIHNRMPVVLSADNEKKWLHDGIAVMKTRNDISAKFKKYRVSEQVNNPSNNIPMVLEKAEENLNL